LKDDLEIKSYETNLKLDFCFNNSLRCFSLTFLIRASLMILESVATQVLFCSTLKPP